MPVLNVKGIPSAIKSDHLNSLAYALASATGNSLGINPEQVSVFFPSDLLQRGLGEELVCTIEGLSERPERTQEVRQECFDVIKRRLVEFALAHLPQCNKIEIIPLRFDQNKNGFTVWERDKK